MEIRITSRHILQILYWLSWIIFVGISIDTGGVISNTVYWMVAKPTTAKFLWGPGTELQALFNYDQGHFLVITFIMSVVGILKATIFYLIIKILHEKKLDMAQPFNPAMGRFIFTITYFTLFIGIFCGSGRRYSEWLVRSGVTMPQLQDLKLAGADVWLFMGVTLFVIAHIFKRGIEIQTENDLTI